MSEPTDRELRLIVELAELETALAIDPVVYQYPQMGDFYRAFVGRYGGQPETFPPGGVIDVWDEPA